MANRTRAQLRAIVEYYTAGSTDYATQINTFLDMAVEAISFIHNFRSLRGMVEATLAADAYYVSVPTDYKETIAHPMWLLSATGEAGIIEYVSERYYHKHFPYPDYSDRGTGTPRYYTKIGDYLYFQNQADKDYTIRLWYQKYHVAFAADGTSHSFKPDYMASLTIVSWVLSEVKDLLPLTAEGQAVVKKAQAYLSALIKSDEEHVDEPMDIEVYFDADIDGRFKWVGVDPYDWV